MSVAVVIPSAGVLGTEEPFLSGALHAARAADEIVVVTTEGKMTTPGKDAIEMTQSQVVDVDGDFNFSRAINAGVAATTSSWVVLMNDDVALPHHGSEDWLPRLIRKRASIKGIRLVTPDGWHIEHAGVEFAGPGGLPSHRGWHDPAGVRYLDGPVWAVTGATLAVSRKVFELLGGFDEDFPLNYGDVDFCLRAQKQGLQTVVYNSIELTHQEASTRGLSDPVPDFRRLIARHGDLLTSEGVSLDPDEADRYFAGYVYV